eukprot:TRINITY_DN17309_c0_g1_i2.p1 TRINITY_DN17309_c0_g1~~TRINITY_DN17309_c0_g1_i2.p1  ORF type:complete len:193 (-),score=46.83 TRINITY_DN17309_c0_g1_i2:268-846(-)
MLRSLVGSEMCIRDRYEAGQAEGMDAHTPLPSVAECAWQLGAGMLVMDFWLYWVHRLMHVNRFMYRHVHSWHHRIHAPYAFSAQFNHPVEGLILDTLSGILVLVLVRPHPVMAAALFSLANVKVVDDHCGMELWWDPLQRISSNNARFHDFHHMPKGARFNFSQPFFALWDRIGGTYHEPPPCVHKDHRATS